MITQAEIEQAYKDLSDWELDGFEKMPNGSHMVKCWKHFENFIEYYEGDHPQEKVSLEDVARYGAAILLAEYRSGEVPEVFEK